MFVQVIQGHVSDASKVRAQLDKWLAEVSPGAVGWLGSTSGVTEDGQVVALARFESEEAAQQNSDRPEQGAWWEGMAALFTDEPVFHDSTTVDVDTQGDPSDAGFVQVMQGRSSDPDRARELMASDPTDWQDVPARHLGHDERSSTRAARGRWRSTSRPRRRRVRASRRRRHPRWRETMKEMESLTVGEPVFFDLRDPWLHSP